MSKRKESSSRTNSKGSVLSSASKHAKTAKQTLEGMLAEIKELETPPPSVLPPGASNAAKELEKRKEMEKEYRKKRSTFGTKLRDDLIKEWNKGKDRDMEKVELYLEASKVLLTKLNLPLSHNFVAGDKDTEKDLLVAMDILEIGARFSVAKTESSSDPKGIREFERYISQLKHYYFDMDKYVRKQSKHMFEILGMNLLNLLSQNKMEEFHMELEIFPHLDLALKDPYIKKAVEIEQWITEGKFNKIYELQKAKLDDLRNVGLTSPGFKYFVDHLESTLREHSVGIASIIGAAYEKLSMQCAMQLLNLNDSNKLASIIKAQNWTVKEGHIYFQTNKDTSDEIPAEQLMKNALMYADELETIV
ncbi:unnamed protein product [Orchesella dallaii]|uniref:26S proteasome non-ATPase regulatory subunit 8 n=1 Tax=Orchesella dallaii TaxID=48710 RepID=A0ABP1RNC5_9HEXA